VTKAVDDDAVVLLPGTYASVSIEIEKAVSVGASAPGAATLMANGGVSLDDPGAVLHDVRIEPASNGLTPLSVQSGTVERVLVTGPGTAPESCLLEGGLVRDTVCVGPIYEDVTAAQKVLQLINVTSGPLKIRASNGGSAAVEVVNSILHRDSPGEADIDIAADSSSSASVTLSHSSFASIQTGFNSGGLSYTQPGTNGNIDAEPLFANPSAGDYRELAGSPTVDAGVANPLTGTTDIVGAERSQGACAGGPGVPDIGAYELVPTATCPSPGPQGPVGAPPTTPSPRPPSNPVRGTGKKTVTGSVEFGKLKRLPAKGTAVLSLIVNAPGSLKLTGKGLVTRNVSPHRAGTVELNVKARGSQLGKLRATGSLKLKATIAFTPTGGAPVKAAQKLTLKLRDHSR
jgi:hypothetical protein